MSRPGPERNACATRRPALWRPRTSISLKTSDGENDMEYHTGPSGGEWPASTVYRQKSASRTRRSFTLFTSTSDGFWSITHYTHTHTLSQAVSVYASLSDLCFHKSGNLVALKHTKESTGILWELCVCFYVTHKPLCHFNLSHTIHFLLEDWWHMLFCR